MFYVCMPNCPHILDESVSTPVQKSNTNEGRVLAEGSRLIRLTDSVLLYTLIYVNWIASICNQYSNDNKHAVYFLIIRNLATDYCRYRKEEDEEKGEEVHSLKSPS